MAAPLSPVITASPPPPERTIAGQTYPSREFHAQSMVLTNSWGLQPASANIVYVGSAPLTVGQSIRIDCGGHTFWGSCKSDLPVFSSTGNLRTLEFLDYRDFLTDWDDFFGAFNKLETRVVNGVRLKRYWHVYPIDFLAGTKTYTNNPLTAAQIITAMLVAPTTESPWQVYHCHPTTGAMTSGYHPSLSSLPSYDIDCMGGKKLGAAIQEVCDQHGILFCIQGAPYRLTFARKGEGIIPIFPDLSDDRRDGIILSRNPTRYRVVGSRNRYQVLNVPLVPDWVPAWQTFFDPLVFIDWIFNNLSLNASVADIPSGTRYNAIPGDTEFSIGYQLASARAMEITVAEFANLVDAGYRDYHYFAGRPRVEMPAILYIQKILFRAFAIQSGWTFINAGGFAVSPTSATISRECIAQVSHSPTSGAMSYDLTKPSDGPGYAIIQGYQVGQDGFRTIRPERFNINEWTSTQNVWQATSFEIDDSGDVGGQYILFEEPVIKSSNLFVTDSNEMNGVVFLNKAPTFITPPVRASLCFQAERFLYSFGPGVKDDVINVPELYNEYIGSSGAMATVPFTDGQTAIQKASDIANSLLVKSFFYAQGGFRRSVKLVNGLFPTGQLLSGVIDRVTIRSSPAGVFEEVDFTSERPSKAWEPARNFDRVTKDRDTIPGQKELRDRANQSRLTAAALRQSPKTAKMMADAYHGIETKPIIVYHPTSGVINPGTPLWQKPIVFNGVKQTNTRAAARPVADAINFVGATVLFNEQAGTQVRYSGQGVIFCRVKGVDGNGDFQSVATGASVGRPDDVNADYLVPLSNSTVVGTALQSVTAGETRVIQVRVGISGATTVSGGDSRWS